MAMETIPDKKTPILIVDDDISLLTSIRATFAKRRHCPKPQFFG